MDRQFERDINKQTEADEERWDAIDNPPEEPVTVAVDPSVDEVSVDQPPESTGGQNGDVKEDDGEVTAPPNIGFDLPGL